MSARTPRKLDSNLFVPGFRASGVHCGIKGRGLDLALLVSDVPASAAGVFTRSTVVGAPVELSRKHVASGRARAVVVNSGISNVAMGARGARDALAMTQAVARGLDCLPRDVLVASTGVIGEPLPMPRIRKGIPQALKALKPDGLPRAARAIMTTDTVPKLAACRVRIGGKTVRVAGIAKGSGMIEPNMATMLAFVFTDAEVSAPALRQLWRAAVDASLNRVTIDGEGSTSDMALALANGLAGNAMIRSARGASAKALGGALERVCTELAQALAADGEGATKLVHVRVSGARNGAEAERAARRIANSVLVKTALFGGDPNWGRILQTVGAGRIAISLPRAEVKLAGVSMFRGGRPAGAAARRRCAQRLARAEIPVEIRLGAGRAQAELWTCDLSYDYVKINAEYTT